MMPRCLIVYVAVLMLLVGLPSSTQAQQNDSFLQLVPRYGKRVLYVSGTGSDLNHGRTTLRPFRTLQKAADNVRPGDTVWVMDGIYTTPGPASTVLYVTRSGTSNLWIRFKAYPGHNPIIRVENNWGGVTLAGASYIEIDGIKVEGNRKNVSLSYALSQSDNLNNPITSGNGISITNLLEKIPHHIIIRNCHVYDCCGGGIATENADYVRIENNIVHNNAYFSPYSQSGISMYLNANSDNFTGTKMVVSKNVCYQNQNFVPSFYSGMTSQDRIIADGNGIIIDDTRNIQNDIPTLPYLGTTLVDRNVMYDNGGRGLVVYLSDNVQISNNISVNNSSYGLHRSDIRINKCSNVRMLQNLIIAKRGRLAVEVLETSDFQMF
jgi:Right handed beta helix region